MRRYKKRMLGFAIVFAMFLGNVTAWAAQVIPELNLELQCPEGWVVFDRNVQEDDPNLQELGVAREEMLQLFEESGIYLNAVNMQTFSEIVVTMVHNNTSERIYDLSLLTQQELEDLAREPLEADMSTLSDVKGVHYDSYTLVDHPEVVLLEYRGAIRNEMEDTALLQCMTMVNGQHINATLRDYSGEISEQEEAQFHEMIQSLHFTELTKKPADSIWSFPAVFSIITAIVLIALAFVIGIFLRNRKKKQEEFSFIEPMDPNEEEKQ